MGNMRGVTRRQRARLCEIGPATPSATASWSRGAMRARTVRQAAVRPLAAASVVAPVARASRVLAGQVSAAALDMPAVAERGILIIARDYSAGAALRAALERAGIAEWHIETAHGQRAALDAMRAHPPRILLLDIGDGGDEEARIASAMRADEAANGVCVLYLTEATSLDLHARGLATGLIVRPRGDFAEVVTLVCALLADD